MKNKYKKRGSKGKVTVTIVGIDNISTLNELIDLESPSYKKKNYNRC